MSKSIEPEKSNELFSGAVKKHTLQNPSRQGVSQLVDTAGRFIATVAVGGAGILGANSVASADNTQGSPNLLVPSKTGEQLNIMVISEGASKDTVRQMVELPHKYFGPEFADHFNWYSTGSLSVGDPKCSESGPACGNDQAVYDVIAASEKAGITPHLTFVVQQATWRESFGGWSDMPSRLTIPDYHYLFARFIVPIGGLHAYLDEKTVAAGILHEVLHTYAGWDSDALRHDLRGYWNQYPYLAPDSIADLNAIIALGPARYGRLQDTGLTVLSPGTRLISLQSLSDSVYQLNDMNLKLAVHSAEGTTRALTTIAPVGGDGPGFPEDIGEPRIIAGWNNGRTFITSPVMGQGPYIFLPDMTYLFSEKLFFRSWPEGPLNQLPEMHLYFHTPKFGPNTLSTPMAGILTSGRTPVLRWNDSNSAAWYYEVQVSGDKLFRLGADATSFVYWNLVHGGQTNPLNSWKVPQDAALAPGDYFWRVRHRVQGDGVPEAWGPTWQLTEGAQNKQIYTPTRNFLNPFGVPILGSTESSRIVKPILDLSFTDKAKEENNKYLQVKDAIRVIHEEDQRKTQLAQHAQAVVDSVLGKDTTSKAIIGGKEYVVTIPAVDKVKARIDGCDPTSGFQHPTEPPRPKLTPPPGCYTLQGDGAPVNWGQTWSFTESLSAKPQAELATADVLEEAEKIIAHAVLAPKS